MSSFLDPVPARRETLLADASNRQNQPAQSDLARHGDVLAYGLIAQRRDDRGRDRHAGRWAVLRDRAGRDVHVQIVFLEGIARDAEAVRLGADEADGRARRLLHDVAQLSRQNQIVMASGEQLGFDEEDVAAGISPGDARRDART